MNKLAGKIAGIQSSTAMSMVEVDAGGALFSALVLETPDTAAYLKPGSSVEVIFKETEVSIAKGLSGLISIRNRFYARIAQLEEHSILTTVRLAYKGMEIVSIISTSSARRLNLNINDEVEWLVKTNEVSLCPTI
jgi:molybdate transport system regulatory protein